MASFEELQNAYNQAAQAHNAYWSNVTAGAQQLVKSFAEYLRVNSDQKVDVYGSAPLPVLTVGYIERGEKFDHRPYQNLPRKGDSMSFALRIVFGGDASGEVPIDAVFQLSIQQGEELDIFVVELIDDLENETFRGPSFYPLFDRLTQLALEKIATAQRG